MKIAFFGTKDYDKIWFGALTEDSGEGSYGIDIHFIEANINEDTAVLAKDHDAVCGFVNSDFSRPVLTVLHKLGIKLILMSQLKLIYLCGTGGNLIFLSKHE